MNARSSQGTTERTRGWVTPICPQETTVIRKSLGYPHASATREGAHQAANEPPSQAQDAQRISETRVLPSEAVPAMNRFRPLAALMRVGQ